MSSALDPYSLSRRLTLIAASCAWLCASAVCAADEPDIQVALGAQETFVGETVDFQVEIRNAKNPPAPDLSAFKSVFDVVASGDQSRNQSSTFIINGRVSQQNVFSHVYLFRLTPKSAGKITLPSVTATIDGKTISSEQPTLNVLEIETQDLVLVEVEANHRRVYPTQPFTVMVRVLVKPLPKEADRDPLSPLRRQPPHLQINWVDPEAGLQTDDKSHWLQPLLADDGIGFRLNEINARGRSIFDNDRAAVFNLLNGREARTDFEGHSVRYFVYELGRTLTPEKTGTYTFGPAIVKGTFAAGVERNEYTARRLVASSSPVTVEVREVPSPRPVTYCGGIGEYQVAAAASPVKLRVGDPLTLTLELVRGDQSGSLELISAPDLSEMPELMADFELIDKSPTGRIEGSVKRFAYSLRPKHSNVSIPSLTVATFDPQAEQFVDLKTNPISLEVTEAVRVGAGDLVGTRTVAAPSAIKSRAEGIFQNITDPTEFTDDRVSLIHWSEMALAGWCVAGAASALLIAYRHKSTDAVWLRRQQARRAAQRRLTEARGLLVHGQRKEALRLVRAAFVGLIADIQNRVAEGLTTTEIDSILATAVVPQDERMEIVSLLDSIESGEYGAAVAIEPAASISAAERLIPRLAARLERGGRV